MAPPALGGAAPVVANSAATDDAQAALASLLAIERSARVVATDAAILVGTAHHALQSVRGTDPHHLLPTAATPDARSASAQLTLNTAEHMSAYRDTAQHAAEAVSVSVAQGRSFIARCEELDREMVKVDALAGQVCPLSSHGVGARGQRRGQSCPAHIYRWPSSEPLAPLGPDSHLHPHPSPPTCGAGSPGPVFFTPTLTLTRTRTRTRTLTLTLILALALTLIRCARSRRS